MFVKEPVKVAPAAVQTLMAPHCQCVCSYVCVCWIERFDFQLLSQPNISIAVAMAARKERNKEDKREAWTEVEYERGSATEQIQHKERKKYLMEITKHVRANKTQ